MRIALVQQHADEDTGANLARAESAVRSAATRGAEVVCLPEIFRSRYFPQTEDTASFDLAEPVPGLTSEHFSKLARELGVVLVVPVFEQRGRGVYHNAALVLDADGTLAGHYRKMHLPDDPGFHEKFYFAPGDRGFHAFDTAAGRIGVLICWDQWFPEAARLLALDGADVIFYPSAIAWSDGEPADEQALQLESWLAVQRGHAIANGVFVAAVNRVGREGQLDFWGSSFVVDPCGRELARAPTADDALLVVDCPPDTIERQRRAWPFLRDRRVDAYGDLLERLRR